MWGGYPFSAWFGDVRLLATEESISFQVGSPEGAGVRFEDEFVAFCLTRRDPQGFSSLRKLHVDWHLSRERLLGTNRVGCRLVALSTEGAHAPSAAGFHGHRPIATPKSLCRGSAVMESSSPRERHHQHLEASCSRQGKSRSPECSKRRSSSQARSSACPSRHAKPYDVGPAKIVLAELEHDFFQRIPSTPAGLGLSRSLRRRAIG